MKKILGMFLILITQSLNAAPLPLSSTFQIQPHEMDLTWSYLPAMNAWRSETNWKSEKFSVTVIHSRPAVFANAVSVRKQWALQTKQTPPKTKILEDKKCSRQGRVHFVCERLINENNFLLAVERLYWNENSDFTMVRISTEKNRDLLKQFSSHLGTQISSRLPASQKKAVK